VTAELSRLGPEAVEAVEADIIEVYGEAFGPAPYFEGEADVRRFATEALPRHVERPDFRLVIARDAGAIVGFAYGYTGEPGQWWHDWVTFELGPSESAEWAEDAYEFVELAVRPAAQGRGTGARLHDELLEGLDHRTALLSTLDEDTPARRLYRGRGWVALREGLGTGIGRPAALIMGLRLRGHGWK